MLYQQELGGSPLAQVFAAFDLDGYREETEDGRPGARRNGSPASPASRAETEESFEHARRLVEGTLACREAIDERIRLQAENWRLERMPTIDRNILRLAVYEMIHEGSVPKVVVVDEAIELAKKFGSEDSGRFVNGLLDGILHGHGEAPGGRAS